MQKLGWVVALIGGFLLGGLATAIALGGLSLPLTKDSLAQEQGATSELEHLSTKALSDLLMSRVTGTFVADSRASFPAIHGVTFFDQPTSAGDFLCLVRTYRVPHEVVGGRSPQRHEGPLETGKAYGLWIDPSEAGKMDQAGLQRARINACAQYRDFEHLIAEKDPLAASAGLEFLSAAKAAAREGGMSARISCLSRREDQAGRPCDALAYLRTVDLKMVRLAETLSDHLSEDGVPWRASYKLTINDGEDHGHPAMTSIIIAGRHLPGMKVHSIESVTIERDVL